jgi:hypothetical protein
MADRSLGDEDQPFNSQNPPVERQRGSSRNRVGNFWSF